MATIKHIEQLSVTAFVNTIKTLRNYEISEKVDGSNIQFGIDKKGFYTTREDKGGKRIYDAADYPLDFQYTYQRSSHLALQKLLPKLKAAGVHEGCRLEAEVLFGGLPNVVRYDSECNQIILLRLIDGWAYLKNIQLALDNTRTSTQVLCPYTPDGKNIEYRLETHKWKISINPVVSGSSITKKAEYYKIYEETGYLERHLWKTAIPLGDGMDDDLTYEEILDMQLNKRYRKISESKWKSLKEDIKKKRTEFMTFMDTDAYGTLKSIKQSLIDLLIRSQTSHFGPDAKHGGWVEGQVLRNKVDSSQIKIVDKEAFGVAKNFLWKVRLDIADKPQSVTIPRSFYGRTTIALMKTIGQPEFATTGVQRHLMKFGKTSAEIVAAISKDLSWKKGVKQVRAILDSSKLELSSLLKEYIKTRDSLSVTLSDGRTFKYDDDVHQRTLQVFAGIFAEIDYIEKKLDSVNSAESLVFLLLHKQLERIK